MIGHHFVLLFPFLNSPFEINLERLSILFPLYLLYHFISPAHCYCQNRLSSVLTYFSEKTSNSFLPSDPILSVPVIFLKEKSIILVLCMKSHNYFHLSWEELKFPNVVRLQHYLLHFFHVFKQILFFHLPDRLTWACNSSFGWKTLFSNPAAPITFSPRLTHPSGLNFKKSLKPSL